MDNLLILNFSLYETKEGKGSSSSFVWGERELCLLGKDLTPYKLIDISFLPLLRSRPKIPPIFLGGDIHVCVLKTQSKGSIFLPTCSPITLKQMGANLDSLLV
jgi:hypothetical protein